MIVILYIAIFLISYLVVSLSPSIIICKKVKGLDIRNEGSKNAGTTNAIRVMGTGLGILVFILEILKVVIAYGLIYIVMKVMSQQLTPTILSIFILASVIGHCFPIYYGFKGGKGMATLAGMALGLFPMAFLFSLCTFIVVVAIQLCYYLGVFGKFAFAKAQNLKKAVESYEKSLEIEEDKNTRENLEKVKKLIKKQKKESKNKNKKDDKKDKNKDDKNLIVKEGSSSL
jgi:glycerol-3-phosphate acyltransferase PlsY